MARSLCLFLIMVAASQAQLHSPRRVRSNRKLHSSNQDNINLERSTTGNLRSRKQRQLKEEYFSMMPVDFMEAPSEAVPSSFSIVSPDASNNINDDGSLPFHEATFLVSHNAHCSNAASSSFLDRLGVNQEHSIYHQLSVNNVRGLLLDVMLDRRDEEAELRLVHKNDFIALDYGGFTTELGRNLVPFLEEDPEAIVTFIMETKGDESDVALRPIILERLRETFDELTVNGIPLKEMTFKYDSDLWKDHDDWPTLDEIRSSGQRLFVTFDLPDFIDTEYGFTYNQHAMQENYWQGVDVDVCTPRFMWRRPKVSFPTNRSWTRLFFMNHFCCDMGLQSRPRVVGQDLLGGGDNGWGILYPRVEYCMSQNGGVKPNFIALDWVMESEEAMEVVEYLNFGGRVGTGQRCEDDFHCATSSCNLAMNVCQCLSCPAESEDICLGCEQGQYCAAPAEDEGQNNQCFIGTRA